MNFKRQLITSYLPKTVISMNFERQIQIVRSWRQLWLYHLIRTAKTVQGGKGELIILLFSYSLFLLILLINEVYGQIRYQAFESWTWWFIRIFKTPYLVSPSARPSLDISTTTRVNCVIYISTTTRVNCVIYISILYYMHKLRNISSS